jgi:hypothetical protein
VASTSRGALAKLGYRPQSDRKRANTLSLDAEGGLGRARMRLRDGGARSRLGVNWPVARVGHHSPRGTLWPFGTRAAILSVPALLVALLTLIAVLRHVASWPLAQWEGWVLLAVVFLSVLPVLLIVLERLAATGGSIRIPGGLEVAFAAVKSAAVTGATLTISGNLGAPPGVAVADSARTSIFEALREAVNSPIAVVDLIDGHAWWETRLLVLLSGASRLGRPRAIVFLATQATESRRFLGWAPPPDLLRAQIAAAPRDEMAAYYRARALAGQWALGHLNRRGSAGPTPMGAATFNADSPSGSASFNSPTRSRSWGASGAGACAPTPRRTRSRAGSISAVRDDAP